MDLLANRKFVAAAVVFLLAVFVGQSLYFAATSSYTYDETVSVINGYYYLTTHDLRLGLSQPPLSAYLSAIPLFFMNVHFDFNRDSCRAYDNWLCAQEILFESGNDAAGILFASRLMSILAMVGLGAVIFLFASRLFGNRAGLLSLALFAVNPVLISHGSLALTNPFLTFFVTLNLYLFFLLLKSFSMRLFIAFAAAFALALVSKVNAFLLLPVYLVAFIMVWHWQLPGYTVLGMHFANVRWRLLFRHAAVFVVTVLLVMFVVYQFQFGALISSVPPKYVPVFEEKLLPKLPHPIQNLAEFGVFRLPIPFPSFFSGAAWHFVAGEGKVSFLNGEAFTGIRPAFIPTVLLTKAPVAFMLFAVLGVVACARRKNQDSILALLLFLAAAVVWIVFFSLSVNSGVPHIMPVYAFLVVLAGASVSNIRRVGLASVLVCVLLLWSVFASLSVAPHYMAYFNELAGGPDRGHAVLGVPNFDWGQDLSALKRYMDGKGIKSVKLSYFGTADPSYYGVSYEYLASPRFQPWDPDYVSIVPKSYVEPCGKTIGIIAVSATNYHGIFLNNKSCYAWLRQHEPVARVGHTIFIYNIS